MDEHKIIALLGIFAYIILFILWFKFISFLLPVVENLILRIREWYLEASKRNLVGFRKYIPNKMVKMVRKANTIPVTMVLFGVQYPGNVGVAVRVAEAFGFEKVIVFGNKVNPRAAVGAHKRIDTVVHKCMESIRGSDKQYQSVLNMDKVIRLFREFFEQKRENPNYRFIFLEQGGIYHDEYFPNLQENEHIYLVIGSEKNGIPLEIIEEFSGDHVSIYQRGTVRSLNVGSASAVISSHLSSIY